MPEVDVEFHATVLKVEERFETRYDPEKIANAKSEAQMTDAGEQRSLGWFLTLEQFGASFRYGKFRPDIAVGDTLAVYFRKIPKEPPKLEVVPATPPAPPSLTAAELEYIRARLADDAMHERGAEDPALSASIRQKLETLT